jgi:hypothetical protein
MKYISIQNYFIKLLEKYILEKLFIFNYVKKLNKQCFTLHSIVKIVQTLIYQENFVFLIKIEIIILSLNK